MWYTHVFPPLTGPEGWSRAVLSYSQSSLGICIYKILIILSSGNRHWTRASFSSAKRAHLTRPHHHRRGALVRPIPYNLTTSPPPEKNKIYFARVIGGLITLTCLRCKDERFSSQMTRSRGGFLEAYTAIVREYHYSCWYYYYYCYYLWW